MYESEAQHVYIIRLQTSLAHKFIKQDHHHVATVMHHAHTICSHYLCVNSEIEHKNKDCFCSDNLYCIVLLYRRIVGTRAKSVVSLTWIISSIDRGSDWRCCHVEHPQQGEHHLLTTKMLITYACLHRSIGILAYSKQNGNWNEFVHFIFYVVICISSIEYF